MTHINKFPEQNYRFTFKHEFVEGFEWARKIGWENGDTLEVVKVLYSTGYGEEVAIVLNLQPNVLTTRIITNTKIFENPCTEAQLEAYEWYKSQGGAGSIDTCIRENYVVFGMALTMIEAGYSR